MRVSLQCHPGAQRGTTAVEFAILALFLFTLLFAILELGRLFYMANTVQEVTRRAAREQVVRWLSDVPRAQRIAVLNAPVGDGVVYLPAAGEVTNLNVRISFHATLAAAKNGTPTIDASDFAGIDEDKRPASNHTNCLVNSGPCIRFVRATLEENGAPITYRPMIPLFINLDLFSVPIPRSTVIMPAEALGLG